MAYEYIEGESLDVVLRKTARPSGALAWIAALADAVDAAHACGIEHGALHLRDVLVSGAGVCATGFGIARALEHVRLGVPVRRPYAAPELTAGRRWGPPADRFAVAALGYELLTGTRPSGNAEDLVAELRASCADAADAAGLQQAFRNALAEEPSVRSAAAVTFATAVTRAVGDPAADDSAAPGGPAVAGGHAEPLDPGAHAPGAGGPAFAVAEPDGLPGQERPDAGFGPDSLPEEARPDPLAAFEDRLAGSDVADAGGGGWERPQPGAGSRPVAAGSGDVRFDPPDDDAETHDAAVPPAAYDDDAPPPPSPTFLRASAPFVVAIVGGVLVAYLVSRGLGSLGDETAGDAAEPAAPDVVTEWSEQAVGVPDDAQLQLPAEDPLPLVEEPVVPVGDPPLRGAAPEQEAPFAGAAEPPAPAPPPPVPAPPPEIVDTSDGAGGGGMDASAAEDSLTPVAVDAPAPEDPNSAPASATGALRVLSRPPGATVSVDDVVVGITPLEVPDVLAGTRQVRIDLPGYRPWVAEIDVRGAEAVRVGASLEPGAR